MGVIIGIVLTVFVAMMLVIAALFLRRCVQNKRKNKIGVMELVNEEALATERKLVEELP